MVDKNKYENALKHLKSKGWAVIPEVASKSVCNKIRESLIFPKYTINSNYPHPTLVGSSIFNTNVLACSKEAVDVVTNKYLMKLAKDYIQNSIILKCIRSYQISKKDQLFNWHADNVNPVTFETDESRGVNSILYLEDDINEKTFWVAENIFHDKSRKYANPTKDEIETWDKQKKVIKIAAKKGDMVIFRQDIYHKHIAKNIDKLDALWFQIVDRDVALNEKIIVDVSYVPSDKEVLEFLGSGHPNIGKSNPPTVIHQMNIRELFNILMSCLFLIPSSIFISTSKKIDSFLYFKLGINLERPRYFAQKVIHKIFRK